MSKVYCECGAEMECAPGIECWCPEEGCTVQAEKDRRSKERAISTVEKFKRDDARKVLSNELEALWNVEKAARAFIEHQRAKPEGTEYDNAEDLINDLHKYCELTNNIETALDGVVKHD